MHKVVECCVLLEREEACRTSATTASPTPLSVESSEDVRDCNMGAAMMVLNVTSSPKSLSLFFATKNSKDRLSYTMRLWRKDKNFPECGAQWGIELGDDRSEEHKRKDDLT